MSNRDRVREAHRKLIAELGRLPDSAEIARETGLTTVQVRSILSDLKLDYRRREGGPAGNRTLEKAVAASRERSKKRRAAVAEAHARLSAQMGRAPFLHELRESLGYKTDDGVRTMCRRLGLPFGDRRRKTPAQEQAAQEPAAERGKTEEPPRSSFAERAAPRMDRILELKGSGDPASRPERLERAGAGFTPGDRLFIVCPVCKERALIAPRTHPHYLRNRAGEVIFVCSRSCTGSGNTEG